MSGIADRAARTARAARALWGRRQRQGDYRRTFSSPHGRRVLLHLMQVNGILDRSAGTPDPHASLVKDGRRLAVLGILSALRLDENAVLTHDIGETDGLSIDDDTTVDIG